MESVETKFPIKYVTTSGLLQTLFKRVRSRSTYDFIENNPKDFLDSLSNEDSELADSALLVTRQPQNALPERFRNDALFIKGLGL